MDDDFGVGIGPLPLLKAVFENSDQCIKLVDLDGRLQFMSSGGRRVMEVDDFSVIAGTQWLDTWTGEHTADAANALGAAIKGESARFSGYANTAKGNRRFWDVRISPVRKADGTPQALLVISTDITRVRELEQQQQKVVDEMRHRARNALTIVQSIASQTLKGSEAVTEQVSTFGQRLVALSRSYDALLVSDWQGASLVDLVAAAVSPFDDETKHRIRTEGSDAFIEARSALVLSLALNELATNAIKHGALSVPTGNVAVRWSVADETLNLAWQETGGPPVAPPTRKGFGSSLIQRALPATLNGHVRVDYLPGGVVCTIVAPVRDAF